MVKRTATRSLVIFKLSRERGAILPIAAVAIPIVLGAMGLSLDVGNVIVAKQELQAAVNAAALKSAASMTLDPVTGQPDPVALTKSVESALAGLKNSSNGQDVKAAEVSVVGYDIAPPHQISDTFDPTKNQIPAVQVSVTKSDRNANGQVDAFFSKVLTPKYGAPSFFEPKATAIATSGSAPSTVSPSQIIPIAVPKSLMDALSGSVKNQPKTAEKTTSGSNSSFSRVPQQTAGKPYEVRVWDNDCGVSKKQYLPKSSTEICNDDDEHKAGVWHSYDSDRSYSYGSSRPITNEREMSEKDDLNLCRNSDASESRKKLLNKYSSCRGTTVKEESYRGYVPVVESCAKSKTNAGTTGSIHTFAAVRIIRSGCEELCEDSRCEEKKSCGFVDIQLIPRGEAEDSVSNDKDHFCPRLKGYGVTQSEHSYVSGAPHLCSKLN